MASGFDDGRDLAPDGGVGWRRRKSCDGSFVGVAPSTEDNERHANFIQRKVGPTGAASWRPKPVHRVAVKHYGSSKDNQIMLYSGRGLGYYKPDREQWVWQNWRTWPHYNFSCDLGSDGLCEMNAGLRKFMLNVTLWPDADHGCQRSTVETLQSAQLFDFLILMMVTFNLPHGPDNNDVRWNQILGVEDALAQRHNARSCVLFQAHVVDMINELRETGTELPGEKDADLEVWDLWLRRRRLRNKGGLLCEDQ